MPAINALQRIMVFPDIEENVSGIPLQLAVIQLPGRTVTSDASISSFRNFLILYKRFFYNRNYKYLTVHGRRLRNYSPVLACSAREVAITLDSSSIFFIIFVYP